MKTIIRPRGKGKTTELIRLSAATGDIIVCKDEREVARILNEARLMGLKIRDPYTYNMILRNDSKTKGVAGGLLIDNVEHFIQEAIYWKEVKAITVSSEEEQIKSSNTVYSEKIIQDKRVLI